MPRCGSKLGFVEPEGVVGIGLASDAVFRAF
jgi:hypothetical protein